MLTLDLTQLNKMGIEVIVKDNNQVEFWPMTGTEKFTEICKFLRTIEHISDDRIEWLANEIQVKIFKEIVISAFK